MKTRNEIMKLATRLMADRAILPEGESGAVKLVHDRHWPGEELLLVTERAAFLTGHPMMNFKCEEPTTIHRLESEKHGTWMTDLPCEMVQMHDELAAYATGRVLIGGLGLGIVARMCAVKREVKRITVVERDQDVVNLVWPHLQEFLRGKANIVVGDIADFDPGTMYDVALLDTWQTDGERDWTGEVVPLRRKFARRIPYILCWREEVMMSQMIRPLCRVTAIGAAPVEGIPHYWAFARAVEERRSKFRGLKTTKWDPSSAASYIESEEAGRSNMEDPALRLFLQQFLHTVGTIGWEYVFGKYWDEAVSGVKQEVVS